MTVGTLADIVHRLRGPEGCPWDRAQTPASMRPYLIEEAYEVLEAIERQDDQAQCEELGDLLFQIVLLAEMGRQRGAFDLADVERGICQKMLDRHPHVFEGGVHGGSEAWELHKAASKPERRSRLDGLPRALPALLRAHRVGEKVSSVGFDWPDANGAREKVDEELQELDEAILAQDPAATEAEYGDLLLAVASLGRKLGLSAEEALRAANERFEGRFRLVEAFARDQDITLNELDAAALDALWQRAKEHHV